MTAEGPRCQAPGCGREIPGSPNNARDRARKYCSQACAIAVKQVIEVLATCPCGQPILGSPNNRGDRAKRRCSMGCAGRYSAQVSPRAGSPDCVRCGEPMSGDNLYIAPKTGKGRCRNCIKVRDKARQATGPNPRVRPSKATGRRPGPKPRGVVSPKPRKPIVKAPPPPPPPSPARRWLTAPGFGEQVPLRRTG